MPNYCSSIFKLSVINRIVDTVCILSVPMKRHYAPDKRILLAIKILLKFLKRKMLIRFLIKPQVIQVELKLLHRCLLKVSFIRTTIHNFTFQDLAFLIIIWLHAQLHNASVCVPYIVYLTV